MPTFNMPCGVRAFPSFLAVVAGLAQSKQTISKKVRCRAQEKNFASDIAGEVIVEKPLVFSYQGEAPCDFGFSRTGRHNLVTLQLLFRQ
jgi:hypothetical protein